MKVSTEYRFYAKTWMLWAFTLIGVPAAIFCIIMGPLFMFGIIEPANGEPGQIPGIIISIIGILLIPIMSTVVFWLLESQKPIVVCFQEGIFIRLIGESVGRMSAILSLYLLILIWHVITGKAFKTQTLFYEWGEITSVFQTADKSAFAIVGPSLSETESEHGADAFGFSAESFNVPMERVYKTIQSYFQKPETRVMLPHLEI